MFCEKCGAKNAKGAKFCEKCGNKLEVNKSNEFLEKIKNLPKNTKLAMGAVLVFIIVAIVVLSILLNNPVKKVSDYLDDYYGRYEKTNGRELVNIKDILSNNRNDEETLLKIKKTSDAKIGSWVKNFNTNYKNRDDLDKAYQKIRNLLKTIYDYYKGLDYILSDSKYQEYLNDLSDLYSSKVNYLYGVKAEDEYSKYAYFERVIKEDSFYGEAQKYIQDYVKEELDDYLDEFKKILEADEKVLNEDLLNDYIEQLKYLEDNNEAYDLIDEVLEYIKDEDKQKELEKQKEELEDKLPDNLVDKHVVSYDNSYAAKYGVTIKDKNYQSYIQFSFNGEAATRVYRLNKDYKRLRATIVVGENWPGNFKGELIITSGDKELFKSGEITKESNFTAKIDIDITDIDDITLEFRTTDDGDYNSYYLYIVEPYLYK